MLNSRLNKAGLIWFLQIPACSAHGIAECQILTIGRLDQTDQLAYPGVQGVRTRKAVANGKYMRGITPYVEQSQSLDWDIDCTIRHYVTASSG